MGAFAAGLALLGPIGILLDVVIGTAVVYGLYRWSKRDRVSHDNLLHDIDDAGHVVWIKKTPRKPSRRDRQKVEL
jgi:PiT family inorganic phosphate transporter